MYKWHSAYAVPIKTAGILNNLHETCVSGWYAHDL